MTKLRSNKRHLQARSALRAAADTQGAKSAAAQLQAGPRSSPAGSLNYASVFTIDPMRVVRAFTQAETGDISAQAALFEMIEEQDAHVYAELAKRRRSITGLGWILKPPGNASQSEIDRTNELTDMLRDTPSFERSQWNMTDAIGKGLSVQEIDWKTGSTWTIRDLIWVPQRQFRISPDTGELLLYRNGSTERLREWGWVVHQHSAKSGYLEQEALFRVLVWTCAYKFYNNRDLQRFLELCGIPLRLGTFPDGIDPKMRDLLLRAVRNIGNDGAGVVPKSMAIEFIESNGGTAQYFLDSIEYWERKQSLAILGGTLTSQADGKSSTNALGLIHDRVRREIMLHDARQIEPTLQTQIVIPLALINGMFSPDRMPEFTYLTEETVDQGKMVDVLSKAVDMGLKIGVNWAHDAMQIPRAKDDEEILSRTHDQPKSAGPGAIENAGEQGAAKGQLARLVELARQAAEADAQTPDRMASMLARLCAVHEEALMQQVAAVVAEAGDFDQALQGIEALAASRDIGPWAADAALGMTAAHLAGRTESNPNAT